MEEAITTTTTNERAKGAFSWVAGGPLRAPLLLASGLVAAAGLAAEIGEYALGASAETVELFSLSYESNVPTWYSSMLLFCCGLALGGVARESRTARAHWWGLSAIFVYMSLDEAIQIHEYLYLIAPETDVVYFSWVIPAGLIVALVGLAYLSFLRALDATTRWRFVVAGILYVGGALLMELPLGYWTETRGDDNLGYGLIDFVEESMEIVGASFFLLAILAHRRKTLEGA